MKRLETDALWTAIDDYLADSLVRATRRSMRRLQASEAAGLPAINVAPNQGKLLHAARAGDRRAPHPRDRHARRLQHDLARARSCRPTDGSSRSRRTPTTPRSRAPISPAPDSSGRSSCASAARQDVLPDLAAEASVRSCLHRRRQAGTPGYFQWAVKLARRGSLIIVDNVVREGAVLEADGDDVCRACAASSSLPPPTRASPEPRSRPSAPRVTTASPSCSSPPAVARVSALQRFFASASSAASAFFSSPNCASSSFGNCRSSASIRSTKAAATTRRANHLLVGRHDIPRRVFGGRMTDRVLVGLDELVPQLALLDVVEGELPPLFGIVDAREEALQLLLLGNVEEEFERHGAVAGEVQLEIVDVLVALLPDLAGDELFRQVLFFEQLGDARARPRSLRNRSG